MNLPKARILCVPAMLALSAGCTTVGPDYVTPPAPAGIEEQPSTDFEAVKETPQVSAEPLPDRWWELYNDPALDALVQAALTANTDLREAAANLERARATTSEARAAADVQTSVSGQAAVGETSNYGLGNPNGVHDTFSLGGDISYEVDVVGRIRRSIEAATASEEAQLAAYDLARITIVAHVVGAYTDACTAGASLAVARHSADVQRQSLALTQRGVEGGLFPRIDLVRSRGLLSQVEASLPGYEAQRRLALYRLAVLTGKAPQDFPAQLATCHTIPSPDRPIPAGDGTALIRRRPDIRQAERQLHAATAQIGIETAALYPTVSLGASAGTTSRTIDGLVSDSAVHFSLGPLISWTFPNTKVARARIAQAQASAKAALARFDGTVLTSLQETESALTQYARDLEENAALRRAQQDSAEALTLQTRMARNGVSSGLDLLDAQRSLVSADQSLAASNAKLAGDRVTIFLALGGGWEHGEEETSSAQD
ncbi:efflux transporter outer membrane subunit [Altericroceibacterium spongiae]|uniref:Efflux transporter outer membrane subunit n=1 Tax=Altericroceibacterium spongiae TaxID=2320269 RepID=A0A420ECD1_9SPHN|nr:efflux transporter outer membrane subunit [Altericroceibacterium spongiae]RKF18335.1 efflux transporter outer membrane subunit [Altericroceibacterium spongiae]